MICDSVDGFSIIPTISVDDLEIQVRSWGSSLGKTSRRHLKVVSFVSRRTIRRGLREQSRIVTWRLLRVVPTNILVLFLGFVSISVKGELFTCYICCKLFVKFEV